MADSVSEVMVQVPTPVPEVETAAVEGAPARYLNSYVAGALLGVVLLASFVVTGRGLGASGAATRIAAYGVQKVDASLSGGTSAERDTWARKNPYTSLYINDRADAYDDFLVYMFLGVIVGGFLSGVMARRFAFGIAKGPHTTNLRRVTFAVLGGVISAFGARLARGCTSGQALSGGATLALGSWVFMLAVFAGGYALAYTMRKEWL